jgi:catechol 2,3-dioxygenase-like lactoylglutathione lyase family enzyme
MHRATPILRVRNLASSLAHYVEVLGFREDWRGEGIFASVSRGEATIFLAQGDQGHPGGWIWIGVGDAEALCEEFRSRGAKIRHPPTNYYWAYEMQVEDIDGNVLRFGSERRADRPDGPWLDMNGKHWPPPAPIE